VLRLRAPDRSQAVLLVQVKRLLNTRDVPLALEQLRDAAASLPRGQKATPLLIARYLPPPVRERIAAAGAAYADATGNLLLSLKRPALFLRDRGSDRDPWRPRGRPRAGLEGPAAARLVRALADFTPPYSVPELAQRARASVGASYRVVEFLDGEGLLERRPRGPITVVSWRALLQRWRQDYGFERSNSVGRFLEPRGLPALLEQLRAASGLEYVLTGSLAVAPESTFAPARLVMLYVPDIAEAADALGLRAVEAGTNVVLAGGDYDVVFERAREIEGLRMAAPSQVAVDLLTGPGRNPSEASALLDCMERNESRWRT